jgi:hypothetical protein
MSGIDFFRLLSGAMWMVLLIYLWKPARAATKGNATSAELVMSAVWLLCLNRMTFTLVSFFANGDAQALVFCHAFALVGAVYMFLMCSLARRRG